jgi:hypothetical protein
MALLALTACGGQSVGTPSDLDVKTYPADQTFTLSLTMQACSDVCAEYDEASCSVNVKEDDKILEVNASLSWDRTVSESECVNRCGPPKFAHCDVPALSAGTYAVEAGGFTTKIVVQ